MRATRSIIAVVAFALIGLMPFGGASAVAATPSAEPAQVAPATAERKATRKIGIKIVKRNGKLFIVGNVRPPKGPVIIDRGTRCNKQTGTCNFKKYKKVRVKKGRYELRVYAPRRGSLAWRARVGTAKSGIWLTCKQRPGQTSCPVP